ncbi:hypothetical protein ACLOJK_016330 [Asimina triloba]
MSNGKDQPELGPPETKGSQASFLTQCIVLTKRSIQARGLMLVFVSSIMTFMTIGGFPSFVEEMKEGFNGRAFNLQVFDRERLNGHYGVGAFVISNAISSIPYLFLVAVVPCSIAYFLAGLHGGATHFIYFVLVLFVCMLLVEGLMMIVASFVPDFFMGIVIGAGIQGMMMLNNGIFQPARYLPKPFWKYPMYYIAFHNYATQGLFKNEFLGLTFPNSPDAAGAPPITGKEVLGSMWEVETGHSKWVDLGILIGMAFLYRFMFLAILKLTEKAKPLMRALFALCHKKMIHVTEQPSAPAPGN